MCPGLRVEKGVACGMAAVLEYLVAELIDLSSEETFRRKKKKIIP